MNTESTPLNLPHSHSERIVKQALSFQRPERLPVFDGFWTEFVDKWREARSQPPNANIEDYYWIDLKVCVAKEEFFPTRMRVIRREGHDILRDDGWGRIVRTRAGTYFSETLDRVLKNPHDLEKIDFDPPKLDLRYEDFCAEVAREREKGRAVFVKIGGPFIRSTFFRGETEYLIDLVADAEFASALTWKVGEHLLQIGIESLRRTNAYDTGVWIYDDMCNANGPMFSPATFEKIFLPVYTHIVGELKKAGARWVILHCDGNVGPLIGLVLEAGIDGLNPVESASGLDVTRLVPKYFGKLAFIGGVCNTHVLPSGDASRIRRHIEAIVEVGRNGGLIIGTHSIGPDISVESYELYRRIVREKGMYAAQVACS